MNDIHSWGHGIYAIDAHYERPRLAAMHAIVEAGRAAIVDTATNASVPRLLAALASLDIAPQQVDWVILTHLHLDHAGGAGELMRQFPAARLVVHPRGVRHMTNPAQLVAAVRAVYGEAETSRLYGKLLPVPAERILAAADGMAIALAGRELLLLDTPGHARHHICIRDGRSGHIFTGDTFGVSYREFDNHGRQFSIPTTSPAQFEPEVLKQTVRRIAALQPGAVYLTHYSQVRGIAAVAADLVGLIDAHVELALRHRDAGTDRPRLLREGLVDILVGQAERQDWANQGPAMMEILATDIELNAQGLEAWLESGR